MSSHSAFRRAIAAQPDEDTSRLAYADWLDEEGGDPERAELIRAQVKLARFEADMRQAGAHPSKEEIDHANALQARSSALIAKNYSKWAREGLGEAVFAEGSYLRDCQQEPDSEGRYLHFERGFVDHNAMQNPRISPYPHPRHGEILLRVSDLLANPEKISEITVSDIALTEGRSQPPRVSHGEMRPSYIMEPITNEMLSKLPDMPQVKSLRIIGYTPSSRENILNTGTKFPNVEKLRLNLGDCIDATPTAISSMASRLA